MWSYLLLSVLQIHVGFCPTRVLNKEPDCLPLSVHHSMLFSSISIVPGCLRSLQIARQMSLFTSTLPRGWVSATSLSVDSAFVSTQEGGVGLGGSSYGWEINQTCHLYKQRWTLRLFVALLWPVSLSPSLAQPWMPLCLMAGPGREALGRTRRRRGGGIKRACCGFSEADGAVHQMGVWRSNKVVDLGAGTGTVNTASSRIWSAQMFPVKHCTPATLRCLNYTFITLSYV